MRFAGNGSTFAGTYWQIEELSSVKCAETCVVNKFVRLRHVLTRRYLFVDKTSNRSVSLTNDSSLPETVFKMYPVLDEKEETLHDCMCVSIENAQSSTWFHADESEPFFTITGGIITANCPAAACTNGIRLFYVHAEKLKAGHDKSSNFAGKSLNRKKVQWDLVEQHSVSNSMRTSNAEMR